MKQRELVLEAINHRKPPKQPFSWGLGLTREMYSDMEAYTAQRGHNFSRIKQKTEHILTVHPHYSGPPLVANRDYWGIERKKIYYEGGFYEEISRYPLAGIQSPEELNKISWPRPEDFDFKGKREAILKEDPNLEKARRLSIGYCGNPLEIYTWMTGMEETMLNLALNPELVHAALGRICQFNKEMMERAAESFGDLIDILYFADDLGGQKGELISNDTYREIIKPHHKQLMDLGKKLMPHAKIMYHTDGSVFNIIPELIDAGMEIHEAVQTDAAMMEPERLVEAYGEKLCFHGAISVQSLLPQETPEEVYHEVKKIIDTLGKNGGYIAAPSHAIQQGTPPQNVYAMLEAVFGREEFEEICGESF